MGITIGELELHLSKASSSSLDMPVVAPLKPSVGPKPIATPSAPPTPPASPGFSGFNLGLGGPTIGPLAKGITRFGGGGLIQPKLKAHRSMLAGPNRWAAVGARGRMSGVQRKPQASIVRRSPMGGGSSSEQPETNSVGATPGGPGTVVIGTLRLNFAVAKSSDEPVLAKPRAGVPVVRASGATGGGVPGGFEEMLDRSHGRALPGEIAQQMGGLLGADFSGVRIHTDPAAEAASAAIHAEAFAIGSDIYFGQGYYNPTSPKGLALIGHELTHVAQQHGGAKTISTKAADAAQRMDALAANQIHMCRAVSELNEREQTNIRAVREILDYEAEHGTWEAVKRYNALSGDIPGRNVWAQTRYGYVADLCWMFDLAYVAGMSGGTASDILGSVGGRFGQAVGAGLGLSVIGLSYWGGRFLGATVEGISARRWATFTSYLAGSINEDNLGGAELAMRLSTNASFGEPLRIRDVLHRCVLEQSDSLPARKAISLAGYDRFEVQAEANERAILNATLGGGSLMAAGPQLQAKGMEVAGHDRFEAQAETNEAAIYRAMLQGGHVGPLASGASGPSAAGGAGPASPGGSIQRSPLAMPGFLGLQAAGRMVHRSALAGAPRQGGDLSQRVLRRARAGSESLVLKSPRACSAPSHTDAQQHAGADDVVAYIFSEMQRNVRGPDAVKILFNNTLARTMPAGMGIGAQMAAYWRWIDLVRPNGDWDHKPPILGCYGRHSFDPSLPQHYRFDIWSNIHYGYVGAAIGFSDWELLNGAGAAQVYARTSPPGYWRRRFERVGDADFLAAFDDPADQEGIRIGIQLWRHYGQGVTAAHVLGAVRARSGALRDAVTPDCAGTPLRKGLDADWLGELTADQRELQRYREVLSQPGLPLEQSLRDRLERILGVDLGEMRVHTGLQAERMALALNAEAFTLGKQVFFGEGAFDPESVEGLGTLVHEATHVAQASQGRLHGPDTPGRLQFLEGEAHAREASFVAHAAIEAPAARLPEPVYRAAPPPEPERVLPVEREPVKRKVLRKSRTRTADAVTRVMEDWHVGSMSREEFLEEMRERIMDLMREEIELDNERRETLAWSYDLPMA